MLYAQSRLDILASFKRTICFSIKHSKTLLITECTLISLSITLEVDSELLKIADASTACRESGNVQEESLELTYS